MVSVRPLLSAVRRSPFSMARRILASKRRVSPTTLSRTPLRWSFSTSLVSAIWKSCMSSATSSAGRRQFSELNANRVRKRTWRSAHARTVARTASTPRRCPAMRGRCWRFAQRPLPSMMMATCCGTSPCAGTSCVELGCVTTPPSLVSTSYGHQLLFFFLQELVDVGDVPVGHFLDFVLRAALVVLGHLVLLQRLLELVDRVAARVAHRYAGVLRLVAHHLDEVLAALLGERRHRHPHRLALRRGIEPEVGVADRLLDRPGHLLLERRHADGARVDQRHLGDLVDRHLRAVVVDRDVVEDAGVRAPGAHLGEIRLERLDALVHLLVGCFFQVDNDHGYLIIRERGCPHLHPAPPGAGRPS